MRPVQAATSQRWFDKTTFPDKDVSVDAVVQDEALAGLQSILGERILLGYHGNLHFPPRIGHLRDRWTDGGQLAEDIVQQRKLNIHVHVFTL